MILSVAFFLLTGTRTALASVPKATEFEAQAERLFHAGRKPKPDDFQGPWFCVRVKNQNYLAVAPPPLTKKDGDLAAAEGQLESADKALIVKKPGDWQAFRVMEATQGLRLIVEESGSAAAASEGKPSGKSEVTGQKILARTVCLTRKELFGDGSDKEFDAFARETFENGRLPTTQEFHGEWTCAYQRKKENITLYRPPKVEVRDGTVIMPEFYGKKGVKMEINDKAWAASFEDGDVRSAFRLQRNPAGLRLLQEATGVDPTGQPPMGLGKPPTSTSVCIPTAELNDRIFGRGAQPQRSSNPFIR